MTTPSVFEVRPQGGGFRVYSTTRWGHGGTTKEVGGLTSSAYFSTVEAAISWVNEQFQVPFTAWRRQTDGVMFTGSKPFFDRIPGSAAERGRGFKTELLIYAIEHRSRGSSGQPRLTALNSEGHWEYAPFRKRPHYRCSTGATHSHWWRREALDSAGQPVLRCREHEVTERRSVDPVGRI